MSSVRQYSYRFSPCRFNSKTGALFSRRFITWATLLGTPVIGSLAIAVNYFRLSGYDNKVNGLLAGVTGFVGFCVMLSAVSSSPFPFVTFLILTAISAWLARATALDCFASFYSADAQRQWLESTESSCNATNPELGT